MRLFIQINFTELLTMFIIYFPSGTWFFWDDMAILQRYLPGNLVYRPVIQDLFISLHPFYFIILATKFYECVRLSSVNTLYREENAHTHPLDYLFLFIFIFRVSYASHYTFAFFIFLCFTHLVLSGSSLSLFV